LWDSDTELAEPMALITSIKFDDPSDAKTMMLQVIITTMEGIELACQSINKESTS